MTRQISKKLSKLLVQNASWRKSAIALKLVSVPAVKLCRFQALRSRSVVAVISIASDKGGVSKTTIALLVAAEAALDGYKVSVLDCDINQQAAAFGAKAKVPGLVVVPDVNEVNILAALRKAEADSDIVIVDLPGGASALALKAFHRSHFVLVPAQLSMPDVRASMKTIAQIDDAQELARAPIARALVWSRIMSGYESVPARQVRTAIEENADVPIFRTGLMERAAFRDIHISGLVPRQKDPSGGPATNVSALTTELLESVAKLRVQAA